MVSVPRAVGHARITDYAWKDVCVHAYMAQARSGACNRRECVHEYLQFKLLDMIA